MNVYTVQTWMIIKEWLSINCKYANIAHNLWISRKNSYSPDLHGGGGGAFPYIWDCIIELHLARPYPNKKVCEDLFITFGVISTRKPKSKMAPLTYRDFGTQNIIDPKYIQILHEINLITFHLARAYPHEIF